MTIHRVRLFHSLKGAGSFHGWLDTWLTNMDPWTDDEVTNKLPEERTLQDGGNSFYRGELAFEWSEDKAHILDNIDQYNGDPQSISCWVNKATTATGEHIFGNRSFGFLYEQYGTNGFEFRAYDGTTGYTIESGNTTTGSYVHLVGVFDGSSIEMYVDGASVGTDTNISSIDHANLPISAGADADVNNRYFEGDVDHADLYSKALTATEVSNLYNTGSI